MLLEQRGVPDEVVRKEMWLLMAWGSVGPQKEVWSSISEKHLISLLIRTG